MNANPRFRFLVLSSLVRTFRRQFVKIITTIQLTFEVPDRLRAAWHSTIYVQRRGSREMPGSASCPSALANRSENHFVRVRGVFGESSHSDCLIHSLSISECGQKT